MQSSIYPFIYLYIIHLSSYYLVFYPSIYLSIHLLSTYPSIYLFIYLSIHLFIQLLSIYSSIYVPSYLSTCLSIYLSIYIFIYPGIHLAIQLIYHIFNNNDCKNASNKAPVHLYHLHHQTPLFSQPYPLLLKFFQNPKIRSAPPKSRGRRQREAGPKPKLG